MTDNSHSPGPGHTKLADIRERRLLTSIVEVTRSVFSAAAASIFLVDPNTGELVFQAVSGEGENMLPGTRFPRGTGIAGWVAASGQPMMADDVTEVGQFDGDIALSTGYVPQSIMAAPLLRDGECIGVLEVLDRASRSHAELQDVDLLGLLSTQAAIGLEMLVRLQWAFQPGAAGVDGTDAGIALLRRIADRLPVTATPTAQIAVRLLSAVDDLLAGDSG